MVLRREYYDMATLYFLIGGRERLIFVLGSTLREKIMADFSGKLKATGILRTNGRDLEPMDIGACQIFCVAGVMK